MYKERLINKEIIENKFLKEGYMLSKYNTEIERLSSQQLRRLVKKAIDTDYGHTIVILNGTKYVVEIYTEDWQGINKELDMFTIEEYNNMYYNDIPLS